MGERDPRGKYYAVRKSFSLLRPHGSTAGFALDEEANKFATNDLLPALYPGGEPPDAVVRRFAELTTLGEDYIRDRKLRIGRDAFCERLMGNSEVVNPTESRFRYPKSAAMEAKIDVYVDHSDRVYGEVFREYVRRLGYDLNPEYVMNNRLAAKVWDWRPLNNGYAKAYSTLSAVMEMSPTCKVLSFAGRYDLRTSYMATRRFFYQFSTDIRERIRSEIEMVGHMPYMGERKGTRLGRLSSSGFARERC